MLELRLLCESEEPVTGPEKQILEESSENFQRHTPVSKAEARRPLFSPSVEPIVAEERVEN